MAVERTTRSAERAFTRQAKQFSAQARDLLQAGDQSGADLLIAKAAAAKMGAQLSRAFRKNFLQVAGEAELSGLSGEILASFTKSSKGKNASENSVIPKPLGEGKPKRKSPVDGEKKQSSERVGRKDFTEREAVVAQAMLTLNEEGNVFINNTWAKVAQISHAEIVQRVPPEQRKAKLGSLGGAAMQIRDNLVPKLREVAGNSETQVPERIASFISWTKQQEQFEGLTLEDFAVALEERLTFEQLRARAPQESSNPAIPGEDPPGQVRPSMEGNLFPHNGNDGSLSENGGIRIDQPVVAVPDTLLGKIYEGQEEDPNDFDQLEFTVFSMLYEVNKTGTNFAYPAPIDLARELYKSYLDEIPDQLDRVGAAGRLAIEIGKVRDRAIHKLQAADTAEEALPPRITDFLEQVTTEPYFADLSLQELIGVADRQTRFEILRRRVQGNGDGPIPSRGDPNYFARTTAAVIHKEGLKPEANGNGHGDSSGREADVRPRPSRKDGFAMVARQVLQTGESARGSGLPREASSPTNNGNGVVKVEASPAKIVPIYLPEAALLARVLSTYWDLDQPLVNRFQLPKLPAGVSDRLVEQSQADGKNGPAYSYRDLTMLIESVDALVNNRSDQDYNRAFLGESKDMQTFLDFFRKQRGKMENFKKFYKKVQEDMEARALTKK